jgi:hypothetical protein
MSNIKLANCEILFSVKIQITKMFTTIIPSPHGGRGLGSGGQNKNSFN